MLSEPGRESIMALWGLSTYFGKQQALTQVCCRKVVAPCDACGLSNRLPKKSAVHADGTTYPPLGAAPLCVPTLLCSAVTC